ncbi:hypothetical protein BOX15_Mlig010940g2, partial [Macrostomum lignano]
TLFYLPQGVHLLDRQYQPPIRVDADLRIGREAANRELYIYLTPVQLATQASSAGSAAVSRSQPALETYSFEFELHCLKGFTAIKTPSKGAPSISFHLDDGQKKGPLYMDDANNLQRLTEHLASHFVVSLADAATHFFTTKPHDPDALHMSLTELNFFTAPQRKKPSLLTRFVRDPYTTGLNELSKIARVASDYAYGGVSSQHRLYEPYQMPTYRQLDTPADPMVLASSVEDGFEVFSKPTVLSKLHSVARGPEVTEAEFKLHLDSNGQVLRVDELKQKIFRGGMQMSLRKTLWKYLLDYIPWEASTEEIEGIYKKRSSDYYRMKQQWKTISADQESRFFLLRERRSLIEKDVFRTDRNLPYFEENSKGLELLTDILNTYNMYNFDLGYVQGMSDLLSPLLVIMESEVDAFWCFAGFLTRVERNFDLDQAGTKLQLSQLNLLVSLLLPDLSAYLDQQDAANMYFCFRWILVWFKREFNITEIYRLWEVLWAAPPNYHLICCCAALEAVKNFIIHSRLDFAAILKHVNDTAYNIELDKLLSTAEGMLQQLYDLRQRGGLPDEVVKLLGMPAVAAAAAASSTASKSRPGNVLRVQ